MEEVIDVETGEILDITEEDILDGQPLERLITARADAAEQEKEWKRRRTVLDAVILRKMEQPRIVVGELVAKTAQRQTTKTDAGVFAEKLDEMEVSRHDICRVVAAARGFDAKLLPQTDQDIQRAYDAATHQEPSAIWLEVSPVLRRAPAERSPSGR